MTKQKVLAAVTFAVIAVYVSLSLVFTTRKSAVFWIGFSFFIFSMLAFDIITALLMKRRTAAFPVEASIIAFAAIYVVTVLAINILFGSVFQTGVSVFVSMHIIFLTVFAIVTLFMLLARTGIAKQNRQAGGQLFELQIVMYDFEKIKTKLSFLPQNPRGRAEKLIDSLLDELKYSDFSAAADMDDWNHKIQEKAFLLLAETENLMNIQTEDLSAFESFVSEIRQLIQDRNMQIRLLNHGI